jgi:hypothetical protein
VAAAGENPRESREERNRDRGRAVTGDWRVYGRGGTVSRNHTIRKYGLGQCHLRVLFSSNNSSCEDAT